MPHHPKPFFVKARGIWRVQIAGRQHNLGRDEDAAFRRYHELMNRPEPVVSELVLGVVEGFLTWCEKHRSPLTYRWYKDRLESFCRSLLNPETLTVSELKPFHVEQWADSHAGWGSSQRRGAIGAVQRAFLWAEKRGHIVQSPVRHVEKPEAGKREEVIAEEEYGRLLARYGEDPFRDVLEFAWETGARPQEIVRVEARHLDAKRERLEFPPKEAKGKKRFRIIYLTARALEIVRRLAALSPDGKVFRTRSGTPFTSWSVNCRMCRLQEAAGRELLEKQGFALDPEEVKALAATLARGMTVKGKKVVKTEAALLREARKKLTVKAAHKVGGKLCLYNFRHTFCQRLLEAGVDAVTVAALMEHVDANMVCRTYSHMGKSHDYLREELRKAIG